MHTTHLHLQYGFWGQVALWTAVTAASLVVFLIARRYRSPKFWLVAGAGSVLASFLLLNVVAAILIPLPPGAPERVVAVTDPVVLCVFGSSTFAVAVGFVCIVVGLLQLRRTTSRVDSGSSNSAA